MVDIEFDPAFDWLWVLVAGQKAPRVDVAAARALAESWHDSGVTLEELGRSLGSLAAVAERSIGGGAGRAFRNRVDELAAAVPQLVALARQQSAGLLDLALNVELGVYSMMIEIAFFAASIIWALADPFTVPLVPAFITAARIAVTRILEKLHWVVRLLVEALQEGVEEVAQGALAQIIQFVEGNRHEWDGQNSLIEFTAGAAAGGLMGAMFMGMKKLGPRVAGSMLFHGFTEAAAETVVGAGAAGILGGSMDDLWTGAVGGAFTGAVDKGSADAGEKIGELVNGVDVVGGPDIPAIDMPDAVGVPVVQTGDKPGHSLGDSDSGYGSESGDTGSESGDANSGYGSKFGDTDSDSGSDGDSGPAGSGVFAHGPTRIGPMTATVAAEGVGVGGVPGQGGGPGATPGTAAGTPSPGMHLPTPGAVDPVTAGPTLIGVPSG
ncbi:WXG100-like domain-containing protein, partial [Saccharopolyspora elongata]